MKRLTEGKTMVQERLRKIQGYSLFKLSHGRLVTFLLAGVLGWLWVPTTVGAQDFTGFRGRVTDPSGAAVVGATIKVQDFTSFGVGSGLTAVEEKSGMTQSTVSNEVGEYELRGILPGTYTMEVELQGFKKYVNSGVIVYARQPRRVDVQLQLGEVAESITVDEQGARITTDGGTTTYKLARAVIAHQFRSGTQSALIYAATDNNPGVSAT